MLDRLFRRARHDRAAQDIYRVLVGQARAPEFYAECAVPDTVDGRFDAVALHAFLVLHRFKRDRPRTAQLAQALFDTMFEDMDRNLREMGVGDLGVGRRVKAMAQAFYGRIAAYEKAGVAGDDALGAALRRNLYRNADPAPEAVAEVVGYVRREVAALAAQDIERLLAGKVTFGAPPRVRPGEAGRRSQEEGR